MKYNVKLSGKDGPRASLVTGFSSSEKLQSLTELRSSSKLLVSTVIILESCDGSVFNIFYHIWYHMKYIQLTQYIRIIDRLYFFIHHHLHKLACYNIVHVLYGIMYQCNVYYIHVLN